MNWRTEMQSCLDYMIPALSQAVARVTFRASGLDAGVQARQLADALSAALALRAGLFGLDVITATRQFCVVDTAYYSLALFPALTFGDR